ncbi:MAG: membrane protein insertion efficiency factor YidD [Ignavibacteriales bacterium]|jgi:putative component of membrane protein insertase Oxa1/YidC/SpoIIIJ protein YidD|nr:membrane protein insertion efficiency factor YidD [Ignavibacteriaceae bacterium]NLH60796.1 membrane protein insertion efficiency factor YidD [Ignavibacteriales bacterium]HOJ18032.1 membrane protein insertion efficiency factor YidD [Ignavibacteriaceae bacterium]HPO56228.1 membrane protein insertion efficiency factor YidD [Ignavibacteriaceae bacterium]
MRIILLIVLIQTIAHPQVDWERWGKKEIDYRKESFSKSRDYSFDGLGVTETILKGALISYWTFFSDIDGDNCPFEPSCSAFFIDAVKTTNLIEGALLFFDRFARDTNPFNRRKYYRIVKSGRFYDPIGNYVKIGRD